MRLQRTLALLILLPAIANAQGDKVSPSTGLIQIFFGLAVVIGLMLLAAWLFKRIGPMTTAYKVPVKVVGGVSLGPRERIMVIEVADQWIVLGVTGSQINTLSTMAKQENFDATTGEPAKDNLFADWLKKTLEKRKANQA